MKVTKANHLRIWGEKRVLSSMEISILLYIYQKKQVIATKIAKELEATHSHIIVILAEMLNLNIIKKTSSLKSKREKPYILTEKGRIIAHKLIEYIKELNGGIGR